MRTSSGCKDRGIGKGVEFLPQTNNLSLKYQRFAPSGCKDIGIRRFEFVAKTQFLHDQDSILSAWQE